MDLILKIPIFLLINNLIITNVGGLGQDVTKFINKPFSSSVNSLIITHKYYIVVLY